MRRSRAARSVEYFGWLDLLLGVIILWAPYFTASLLRLPELSQQGANYLRLVGLLVSGLGMLYVVSGRLNAQGFIIASMLDRPLVPLVMAVLWKLGMIPGPLAIAFSISDFGGFLWTFFEWRREANRGTFAAALFGFTSGVLRNARTFHPDGRVFRGTVRALAPEGDALAGDVLLRMGMGLMKRGMPPWLADHIPDAPSIAARFGTPEDRFDLLATAGGDRLWKLVLNLATGGRGFGLQRFDYFRNVYSADVPYRIAGGARDVYLRIVPEATQGDPRNGAEREQALGDAVARHATFRLEGHNAGPIAAIRLEEEISLDQEALHFDPVAGRGFEPHGFLTDLRKRVYPASAHSRPANAAERARRESESGEARLARYLDGEREGIAMNGRRPNWWKRGAIACAAVLAVAAIYGVERLNRDVPVDYPDDVDHFLHGSTGGERMTGIPYWLWIALPELFPEALPDKRAGQGYSSFGMIYAKGADPKYALPMGMSQRNVRGIDMVYLNCAVCHTGSVRKSPGGDAEIIAGMPANTFDLGAWGKFLTSVPKDQKFTPDNLLDKIGEMQDDPHRLVDKPDFINRQIFRFLAIYLMRDRLLMLGQRLSFIDKDAWGPGRVDTFNAPKALMNFPMAHADPGELIGNADFPSVWNQGPREGMQLHWDGNNTLVTERNLSAAFGTGAYPPTLDAKRVQRTAKWLETAAPPKYASSIDGRLASRGEPIYQKYCLSCHGTKDTPYRHNPPLKTELVGTVTPIDKIGTDPFRLQSYTWLVAVNQGTLYAGFEKEWGFAPQYPQRFTHFRKTEGYANSPLDGLWLRAPYLHNGSVPTLRELLEPADQRTKIFYRGNDVYDFENVGFVSDVAEQGGRKFFRFNTLDCGNSNSGHEGEAYGTSLPPEEKRALLEYLKSF